MIKITHVRIKKKILRFKENGRDNFGSRAFMKTILNKQERYVRFCNFQCLILLIYKRYLYMI